MKVWEMENNIINPKTFSPPVDILNQIGSFFAAGTFYYYILNFENLVMEHVSESVKKVTGIEPDNFTLESLLSRYHPEDLERLQEKEAAASEFLFHTLKPHQVSDYKVVYLTRYKDGSGSYKTIMHQAKALNVTDDGKVQHVLGVHTDISYLNTPIDHKISLIGHKYPSYFAIDPLKMEFETSIKRINFTKQELRIIQLIAEGYSYKEIAEKLFISEKTVKTHKNNILFKSTAKNSAELVANCIREGII